MANTIIVGGGAAGMMAAVAAADSGGRVCLIEKNEKLGKKLFITGKGRCNITNAADMDTLLENVCVNRKFLYSAFYDFDNRAVMDFLEQAGCPLKTERGERVFPVSDHSSDVTAAFVRELKKRNVRVLLNTEVKALTVSREDGAEKPRITGVRLADGTELAAEKVIVCTGGVSYPSTGSTGDGYRFAEETGHRVIPPRPALVPLEIKEAWCADLMGLSLKNVSVRMVHNKKELYRGFGEMLFTHFGVSGPLILSAGSYYNKRFYGQKAQLHIDLKPALSREQLDTRILRDFEKNKNRLFKNALEELLPSKMIPVIVSLSCICPETKVNGITRSQRAGLEELLKNLTLTVTGTRGFSEAIVTQGGVRVKEVNPSTMESRLIRGLYFAGELLDLDAVTGGFNLQIAWSTGYLAGVSAAKEE